MSEGDKRRRKSPQRGETFKPRVKPWVLNVPKTPPPRSFPVPTDRADQTVREVGNEERGRNVVRGGGVERHYPGVIPRAEMLYPFRVLSRFLNVQV